MAILPLTAFASEDSPILEQPEYELTAEETQEEHEIPSGDSNADRKVISEDAMCILKFLAGLEEELAESNADVNEDGVITGADAA